MLLLLNCQSLVKGYPWGAPPALFRTSIAGAGSGGQSSRKDMQVSLLGKNAFRELMCTKMLKASKGITSRVLTASTTELKSIVIKTGTISPKLIEQAGSESEK